jgi:hypothetical protein
MDFARYSEARPMAGFFADSIAVRGDARDAARRGWGTLRCATIEGKRISVLGWRKTAQQIAGLARQL